MRFQTLRSTAVIVSIALISAAGAVAASAQNAAGPNWREAERGMLERHVQLTFPDRFIKAGESYFSPDDSKIIFQGVEHPRPGEPVEAFYQMFVAEVVYDDAGAIRSLDNITRLSPPGSWNTCGWFHPTRPGTVIFASSIVPPEDPKKVGFQRERGEYAWYFPKEMTIVECDLSKADGTASSLRPLVADAEAYLAECVLSDDGRYVVYCRRPESEGRRGGDLLIRDLTTGEDIVIAGHAGYDGGPFFSPDGRRLCYRSDRRGDNLLQVFVAELAFDGTGRITGISREFQLTDNDAVNWAPFWTRDGRHLVYTTSAHGHTNYEIYIMDADPGDLRSATSPAKYGTRKQRITHADRFDGLPAFNADGTKMIWTSQRGEGGSSQLWAADFVLDVDRRGDIGRADDEPGRRGGGADAVYVVDPDTGKIFVYELSTHNLYLYDPATHTKEKVSSEQDLNRAMELFRQREEELRKDDE